jgi:hypothetical protein
MIQIVVWFAALVVTAVAAGALGIQAVVGRKSRRMLVLTSGILALSSCLAAADGLGATGKLRLDSGYILLIGAGVIVLAASAVALQLAALRRLLQTRSVPWTRAILAGLLACQIVAAGWAGWRFQQAVRDPSDSAWAANGDIEAIAGEALLTNKGRLVPVYRWRLAEGSDFTMTSEGYADRRIERAGKDPSANCHGWVFTGGQYLLTSQCVETILADNEYQVVAQPRPGDVIVYRDAFDLILHSGLVRLALDDGLVLIESKWGLDARYLHLPEDQGYSQWFKYYRRQQSPSPGSAVANYVQAVKILPGSVIVSQRPEEALVATPQPGSTLVEGNRGRWPMDSYPLGAE